MASFTLAILGVGIYFATRYFNARKEVNSQKATATVPVVDINPHGDERAFENSAWQLLSLALEGNYNPLDLFTVMQEREAYLRSRFEDANTQASKAYDMLVDSLQDVVLYLGKVSKGCKPLRKSALRQSLISQARKAIAGDALQDFFELSMGYSPETFADGLKRFNEELEQYEVSARIDNFHKAYAILCSRLQVFYQRNDWKNSCYADLEAYQTFLTNNSVLVSMVLPDQ